MFVEEVPPRIEGPTIECQQDYFVMLHELGHVALGHGQGRPPHGESRGYFDNGVLRSEAQAWEWALDEALEEPLLETRVFAHVACLGSYHRLAVFTGGREGKWLTNGDRAYVSFVFDEPDEYFWSVMDRLKGVGE